MKKTSLPTPFRSLSLGAAVVALATLTACASPGPAYETARYPYHPHARPIAQNPYVDYGRIANIEVVRSETQGAGTSGGGAIAGGLLGGVVGNQFGGGGGRAAMTALGVVGGALLGNRVESNNNAPRAYETYRISVQTDQGGYRAFDVPTPGDLRTGDRVRIENNQLSRY
ncbi:glycine zipper 2TM domain-containing protein [Comamonadaceae bacterium OTU4NAUVB1]|jgi:outer membrane lipoprotein SlyB|nr:glycine zipper 2TM domain-containing protein [Comamonadaceae bacterium OTU4NAUVB1]HSU24158.1 glycine zipper 2TM domain-containing protein [Variovorax sp.]